jgi:uncharacterized membrane protein (DUF485 family)
MLRPLDTMNGQHPQYLGHLVVAGTLNEVARARSSRIWEGMRMLHEPAPATTGVDEAAAYKRRLGLKMLAFYGTLYVIFIIINVAWPTVMGTEVVAGLNLAIIYGFALIVIAFLQAILYNWLCTRHEKAIEGEGKA